MLSYMKLFFNFFGIPNNKHSNQELTYFLKEPSIKIGKRLRKHEYIQFISNQIKVMYPTEEENQLAGINNEINIPLE